MPESPLQHNSPTPSHLSSSMSPNTQLEQDKRVRREIANSNERRRMQSINTGFQSLKILIPHSCGEKLSKACILQRAADHIKSLENEKLKLQSQNEQFRILIKSFQIDSTSILQGKRHLSTNEQDEFDDRPTAFWHAQYIANDEKFYSNYKQPTTSDTTYMIVKQNQPSQRCYKTNSLDQNQETDSDNIVIVERCQVRSQSLDTPTTVSRRNLQTIVEAIRHLEGDDVLSTMTNTQTPQQEELPAQIKAMINEKFQPTNLKNPSSTNAVYQQTIHIHEPTSTTYDVDLHQKPPKKRKITFNESDQQEQLVNESSPISLEAHHPSN